MSASPIACSLLVILINNKLLQCVEDAAGGEGYSCGCEMHNFCESFGLYAPLVSKSLTFTLVSNHCKHFISKIEVRGYYNLKKSYLN